MIVEPSWALGSETDETALERKGDGVGSVVDAELSVDVNEVTLHGGLANVQFCGDLSIVESLRCEHENVELAGRECVGLVGFTDKI